MNDLNDRLLAAHRVYDQPALVALYTEAAAVADEPDAKGFYLTQAYVYALELGHPDAPALRADLIRMGRETTL
jgi:hypothetical protein